MLPLPPLPLRPGHVLLVVAFALLTKDQLRAQQAGVPNPTRDSGAGQLVDDKSRDQLFPIAQARMPQFPELPALSEIEPGVFFGQVELTWDRGPSKLWIYLPSTTPVAKSLPCVFIAPPNGNLIMGGGLSDDASQLSNDDRVEHALYVKAGFAVVAYDLELLADDKFEGAEPHMLQQIRHFAECYAGLRDARAALEFALAKIPAIDAMRLFAAGHDTAATEALLFAEHESRLRGCVALAAADIPSRMQKESQAQLETLLPGFGNFLERSSPRTHVQHVSAPVFVFHAEDDESVPFASAKAFVELLHKAGKTVEFDTVKTGGHEQPVFDIGIPHAIAWMRRVLEEPHAAPTPESSKKEH
jgi:dienelactone hydrolase